MTADIEQLFASIVVERGGLDSLSVVSQALARALAVALATEPVNPATITALTGLLPPPLSHPGGVLDLSKLTDAELDRVEAMRDEVDSLLAKAGSVPPDLTADAAHVAELLTMNRGLNELVARTEERVRIAEQSAAMYRRMTETASETCAELRARLAQVTAAVAPAEPTPVEQTAPAATPAAPAALGNVLGLAVRKPGTFDASRP